MRPPSLAPSLCRDPHTTDSQALGLFCEFYGDELETARCPGSYETSGGVGVLFENTHEILGSARIAAAGEEVDLDGFRISPCLEKVECVIHPLIELLLARFGNVVMTTPARPTNASS